MCLNLCVFEYACFQKKYIYWKTVNHKGLHICTKKNCFSQRSFTEGAGLEHVPVFIDSNWANGRLVRLIDRQAIQSVIHVEVGGGLKACQQGQLEDVQCAEVGLDKIRLFPCSNPLQSIKCGLTSKKVYRKRCLFHCCGFGQSWCRFYNMG